MRAAASMDRSPRLAMRVLLGFGALAAFAAVALLAVIGFGTLKQDQRELEASTRLAQTAVHVKNDEIGRTLRDYANWEEALLRMHPAIDLAWAYDEGNLGANIHESLGYEYIFVIDAAGRTTYAVERGALAEIDALTFVGHGLDRLVALARERVHGDLRVANGAVTIGGAPAFASVAVLWPTDPTEIAATPATAPVLVFVDMLDRETLDQVAANYLLSDLRFAARLEAAEVQGAALPLMGADGQTLGWLRWRPDRPGTALLHAALPWLLAAGSAFGFLASLVARFLRRAVAAAAVSEARFRDVATSASDWIFETDRHLGLGYLSGRFTELTGLPVDAMLGRRLTDIVELEAGSSAALDDLVARPTSEPVRGLFGTLRDANGRRLTLRLTCCAVLGAGGRIERFRGTASDVTAEVEAQARAEYLALHDPLTGLPNRLLFAQRLTEAAATARRDGRPSACLYLDLDKFKDINDTLGHQAGDTLLRAVTARLRGMTRETDTVARLGGDEFAVLLAGCGAATEAEAFCRRALEVIASPFELDGQLLHVRASIGVAFLPGDAQDAEPAMRCADLALYQAKTAGRGSYRFYARRMNAELQRRRGIEEALRRALARGELELHYQPKHRTAQGDLTGFEALLRWRHPERGLVPPSAFIDVAESSGLIVPIGEWVLETACAHAACWPDLDIAVNLSSVQFKSPGLVDAVRRAVALAGIAPQRLELEVTESLLVDDLDEARAVLLELKALGVKLALDAFGTGYSSLAYLHSLPFDRIKIDRSFVARLGAAREADAIVQAVVALGHGLGMKTTAEGVETSAQLAFLRSAGCDEAQGYLLGRPVPAEAADGIALEASAHPHRTAPLRRSPTTTPTPAVAV